MTREESISWLKGIKEKYIHGGDEKFDECRKTAIDMAIEALKQPEWIPVSEALPKRMANKVLVYLDHEDLVGYIGFGHYEKYQGEEMWYDLEHNEQFSKRGYTVTHWMPLPQLQKDGGQE